MKKLWSLIPLLLLTLMAPAFAAPVVHETPATVAMEQGEFVLTATAPDGSNLWEEQIKNAFADEGEQLILDVFLRGAAAPSGFFLRLYNDTPVETDTLSTLTGEPSGNGYSPATVERSATGEAIAGLVSQVAPYDSTAVRYFVDPGAAGLTKRARVALTFSVVTSNGQTLTDVLQAVIV